MPCGRTLQIDDDVLESVRLLAEREGRSVESVLSDLARRMLRPSQLRDDGGFPVFDVPDIAPSITSDDVVAALDEE